MSFRYPTHYNDGFSGQETFEPKDIPFNSLRSMASSVTNAMMPDLEVHKISLTEEKDGAQVLEACWIDTLEAMARMAGLSKYRGKLDTQFEPAFSESSPRERVYSRANSGRVFEAAQDVDPDSSPLIAILASDKSYSGQHQGQHPIYCKNL